MPSLPKANLPIRPETADAASDWLTRIMSGEMNEADYRQWQDWRNADPDHEQAWQQIEAVSARLRNLQRHLQPQAAYQSLSATQPASPDRRKLLGALLVIGGAGGLGIAASRTPAWHRVAADFRTGVGEQREFQLDDGTRLLLNTASAVDVQVDGERRLLHLRTGEVMVNTGRSGPAGQLCVVTHEGQIRALGTRFNVRQHDGSTQVTVLEHSVEITPDAAPNAARILQAGEAALFTRTALASAKAVDEQTLAWTRGQLIAADVRLADFLTELDRYRHGVLRCDPAVADLRFSGVFPLRDPEQILTLLPNSLPVRIRQLTRYWTVVERDTTATS